MLPQIERWGEVWFVRGFVVVVLVVGLSAVPLGGALTGVPAVVVAGDGVGVLSADALVLLGGAWDPSDVALLTVLAARQGHDLVLPELVVPDASLEELALRLAARAEVPASAESFADFATLDPQVREPVRVMLAAMLQSWDLVDAAYAGVDRDVWEEYASTLDPDDALIARVVSQTDQEALLNAAILLLDTIDSIVVPALTAAADNGVWPPVPVADPVVCVPLVSSQCYVGIVRIGSSGDDYEPYDRLFQIDALGNDLYEGNAGGADLGGSASSVTVGHKPIAISLDLSGDDTYDDQREYRRASQGAGLSGIGIMHDYRGNDDYSCANYCLGGSATGYGQARDHEGDDTYSAAEALGYSRTLAVFRDDQGDDYHIGSYYLGGFGLYGGVGLFWDRNGDDTYEDRWGHGVDLWGWGRDEGVGLFVDEGPDTDTYIGTGTAAKCNTCTWTQPGPRDGIGYGNENYGGLAYLLAHQWPALDP